MSKNRNSGAFPWSPGWKSKPLDASLYGLPQRMAAEGKVPADHPAWKLDEKDERRFIETLAEIPMRGIPDMDPAADPEGTDTVGNCIDCGAYWRSLNACHCATCHLTFTAVGGFEFHRFHGTCRTETELRDKGYAPNDGGYWRKPMADSDRTRRFGEGVPADG